MEELDDLLSMLPEGSFKDKEELGSYISENGIADLFDGIPQGTFKDVNEYTNYFSSLKKKEESESTAKDTNVVSEQEVEVGSSVTPQDEPEIAPKDEPGQLVKDIDSGKLDGRIEELQAENDASEKAQAEKEANYSVVGENFRALKKGSARLGRNIAATPELIYDVFAAPQNALADKSNLPLQLQFLSDLLGGEKLATDSEKFKELVGLENTVKDYYSTQIENITKEQEEKDKPIIGDITTNIKNGNIGDAFRMIGKSFSESLPSTMGIMLSGAGASQSQILTGVTTVFGADSNEEYKKENPEISTNERVVKSLGKGFAEGVFSTIGSAKIGVAAKQIIAKEGKKEGSKILKTQLVDMYTELLKKYPIPTAMLGEGLEEAATSMTQNAIDGKPIMEGVSDAFIVGFASGGAFGIGLEGIKKISKGKTKPTDIEHVESLKDKESSIKEELTQQVKEGDLKPTEAKDIYDNWEEIKNNLQAVPEEFTPEQKAKAVDVIKEKKAIEIEIKGKDPALVEEKKAKIEELNNELKNINAKSEEATTETKKQEVETATPSTEAKQESVEPTKEGVEDVELGEDVESVEKDAEDFDYGGFIDDLANTPTETEQEVKDRIREEKFKQQNYDPNWAKDYKTGRDKTVKKFKEAKAEKEKWEAKQYKSAGNKRVEVGDELGGKNVKIDQINENRKKRAIRNADAEMKEAYDLLKELGLSESEIKEATNESKTQGDTKPVKVTQFKKGSGGTLGIFKGEDGKTFKSTESLYNEFDPNKKQFYKKKTGKQTDEHALLSENKDLKHLPKVGKVVETSEGKAFEIETLQEVEKGSLTLDEIKQLDKTLSELNKRGVFINDLNSVMRRDNGEIVLIDLSHASKRNPKTEQSEDISNNVIELLSPKNQSVYNANKRSDFLKRRNKNFNIANKKTEHVYYLTQRPPSIGTHPDGQIKDAEPFKIGNRTAYKVTYNTPLSKEDIKRFELTEELTMSDVGRVFQKEGSSLVHVVENVDENEIIVMEYFGGKSSKETYTQRGFTNQVIKQTNETTPQPNTNPNADVQPTPTPSVQQGKDNNVQKAVEPRASEAEVEVKPTLDEIGDFLDSVDLETDKKDVKPKKKSNAKKVTLGNKTPLDKKKIKDPEMLKAIDTEVFDVDSIVQQYFINGGRVLSTEISRLYDGSTAEIRARMGYARKSGKRIEIKEIAHDLWEKHGENLNLDTSDFENAIERVIGEHLSTKSMAVDLNNRNSQNINEELIDTPRGPMTQEQIDDLIKYEQEQEKLVANYLLSLNEDELIKLDQEYKQYEQYETKRLNKESARKSESESRVQKDASRESAKSPEIQEVEKQITKAEEQLSKAKTALKNKAKTLDNSINKDQEDLFGERASQQENQLFDERVDISARNDATAKERQAVKDAETNLKNLKDKKTQLEKGGEVTVEIDFNKKSKPSPIKKEPSSRSEKIDDFGEKIGGARKDIVSELDGITNSDIANLPLSKSFPEPNYAKLIEEGVISKEGAIVLKFLYDSISNKPRSKYRIKTWVNNVEEAIKATRDIIEKESLLTEFIEGIEKTPSLAKKWEIHNAILEGFGFPKVLPKTGAYKITQFTNKTGSSYAITKGSYIIGRDFKTLENAVEGLKTILDKNKTKKVSVKLDVFQNKKTKEVYIGKKTATGVVKLMDGFKTAKDAFQFLDNNRTEVENIWNNLKINPEERRNSNRKRVGTDWRNGKDITPEIFSNAFGFRGVEFGNWVNNSQRQEALNETYDAFMDMANVLGLSPRSMSLNGTLAMAFGARGKGKAMAHYEPGKVVINLTKKKGAGSLAHEWFHAMDNYFSRKYDKNDEYITNRPRTRVNRDGSLDTRIREEVLKAFKDVITAINESGLKTRSKQLDQSKSKLYWSTTIEMGARSFENFIIEKLGEQSEQNDFLANFKETSEWLSQTGLNLENYPYPLKEESDAINGAFSNLFETLDVVPEEGKTVSKLDELGNLLDEWDKNLDQFGKENLSMGLPILVAKAAIKAMKIAHKTAKTSLEVIEAGLKAVKDTDWYKNLTKEEQQEISATTIYQMVKNAQKQNNVNPDDVKAKLQPKKDATPPKTPEAPKGKESDFERKSGKKSLLNRLIEGGNGKDITKALESLGKEYDIRNQEEVDEYANAFIDRVGIGEALNAAQNGLIPNNDVKYLVYAEALERLKNEIDKDSNINDRDALIEQFQQLSNKFDNEVRNAGQGLAILNYIYNKNQNLKYSLAKQIADYKANDPNGEIPKDIEKKFKELDKKLQELEKQTKEAEERAEKAEEELAIKNTQEDIARQKAKQNKNRSSKAKAAKILANKLRTAKIHKPNIFSSASPASLVWDGAIEIVAKTIESGGKIADAVQKGLEHIKASDWHKSLAKGKQSEAEKAFKESVTKTAKPSPPKANENGELQVPKELFRYYVEQGYDDINEIAELIKEDISEEFPDADVREIRDLLTGYGKQINPNKDEITAKMNKLKEYGRLLSAYDDVMSGKMPFKSGLVRVKPEQRARELRRKVNRLAKELELQSIDLETQWANALDKIKSNLKNQIEDLDKQIAKGEKRKVERTTIKLDAEAESLKKLRDEKRKILDELVGKPELTYEQKVKKAETLLERSIEKIKEEIDNNNIDIKGKPTPVQSAKLTQLRAEYKALRATKQAMREQSGIVEKQRLQTSKKRIRTQIEEYKRRLREKDFSKRKANIIKADSELDAIRAEREAVFEEYEKARHRQELKNRSERQKWIDATLEGFAVGRALKASLDLGLIGIQLRHFTYREILNSPRGFARKLIKMFGAIGSQSKSNKARKQLLAHPDYRLANKLDIGLTNPDLRDEVREEASAGSLLSFAWNLPMMLVERFGGKKIAQAQRKSIGDTFINGFKRKYNEVFNANLKIDDKTTFSIKDQWKNLNLFRNVERGLSVYGNQIRFEEFLRGVQRLKNEGKDEINHKEDYEALASYIRTFSGRAKPAGFEINQKAFNLYFFSFKNAASVFQQLNPGYYTYLQGKTADNKDGRIRFKPTVANRMAMTSMLRTFTANAASIAFIMAGYAAIKGEDDDEMTLETDPTSSDFGKLRIGSFRYDPWGGYMPLIVLYARLITEEVKKQDGTKYKMGESHYGIQNRVDAISKFIGNKKAPVTGAFLEYLASTEAEEEVTGETYRKTAWGGRLGDSEALSPMPIFLGSVKEAVENDYDDVKWFLTAYSVLGLGNTQDYGKPKSSTRKKAKKAKKAKKGKTVKK